ncbi:fumarylacetoacetate hydrolase family protein [Nocardioides sp. YIM B13467]|uniref:fumarylacetoacetate hydrolase family protein n=1 Tax=Nocardioides sp. YIM B13467 TaxID=3366294 RepID=UPI00366BEA99
MRIIGYDHQGVRHLGALTHLDKVVPLGTADNFYRDPAAAMARQSDRSPLDLAKLTQVPFVPLTARIFCVGINYHSHAGESKDVAGLDLPTVPMIFGRWQQSLVVNGAPVPQPLNEGLDWEVELAAVIKDEVFAAGQDALDHVLGYTAFNDLSARKKQIATTQFTLGKNPDRSGPIGPALVTPDEIDPTNLEVRTRVNGVEKQAGNTRDLIHSVADIIRYITDTVTLLPGDVIATGTPGGVGVGRTPQEFLYAGDVVEVEVEGVGVLRNRIVTRAEL